MKVTIDKAGRVLIPKAIRERQHLAPGTHVEIVDSGDRLELILPDDREQAHLVKKAGRMVISATAGQSTTLEETLTVRDALRGNRLSW